jgi:hypothetical protein
MFDVGVCQFAKDVEAMFQKATPTLWRFFILAGAASYLTKL